MGIISIIYYYIILYMMDNGYVYMVYYGYYKKGLCDLIICLLSWFDHGTFPWI